MTDSAKNWWWYCGCGCALLAVLFVVSIAGLGFASFRSLEQFTEDMKDPVARDERAREILGADRLPEGFATQVYFRVPRIVDMVILTDGPPAVDGGHEEALESAGQIVLYLESRDFSGTKAALDRYLDGETDDPEFFDNVDIDFDFHPREIVGRGRLEVGDQDVRWIAHTGEMDHDGTEVEGMMALAGIDCPNDDKLRLVTWFERDGDGSATTAIAAAEASTDAASRDLSGGPADEVALSYLLGHFDLCRG